MIDENSKQDCTVLANVIKEWKKFHELNSGTYKITSRTKYDYGTAGFRMNSKLMKTICFRIGLLAGILSLNRGKAVGVMITASHNPEFDNGIKIVEPSGEMLESEWESLAALFANSSSDEFIGVLEKTMSYINNSLNNCTVIVGRDTRESSFDLSLDVVTGIKCITDCIVLDYGRITTPQLHFYVTQFNSSEMGKQLTTESYFNYFGEGFSNFFSSSIELINICVDTANGVGAETLKKVRQDVKFSNLSIDVINCGESGGKLNYLCGADYVKMNQKPPLGALEHFTNSKTKCHYCSWDGDADRIIYYYFDHNNVFHLVDGDKMAALFSVYIKKLIMAAEIQCSFGVLQTAYANGSSTSFFERLGIMPEFACTGVKNLHHSAKKYDIAVYFEANGHGTVVVNSSFKEKIENIPKSIAKDKLYSFLSFANSTVGDAFSDMLLTEAILTDMNISVEEWDKFYSELPNTQTKLKVKDKAIFKTTDADRRLTEPIDLQIFINDCLKGKSNSRCFVRPSGTEDIVRVYCEAESVDDCAILNEKVAKFIVDNYSCQTQ